MFKLIQLIMKNDIIFYYYIESNIENDNMKRNTIDINNYNQKRLNSSDTYNFTIDKINQDFCLNKMQSDQSCFMFVEIVV